MFVYLTSSIAVYLQTWFGVRVAIRCLMDIKLMSSNGATSPSKPSKQLISQSPGYLIIFFEKRQEIRIRVMIAKFSPIVERVQTTKYSHFANVFRLISFLHSFSFSASSFGVDFLFLLSKPLISLRSFATSLIDHLLELWFSKYCFVYWVTLFACINDLFPGRCSSSFFVFRKPSRSMNIRITAPATITTMYATIDINVGFAAPNAILFIKPNQTSLQLNLDKPRCNWPNAATNKAIKIRKIHLLPNGFNVYLVTSQPRNCS